MSKKPSTAAELTHVKKPQNKHYVDRCDRQRFCFIFLMSCCHIQSQDQVRAQFVLRNLAVSPWVISLLVMRARSGAAVADVQSFIFRSSLHTLLVYT